MGKFAVFALVFAFLGEGRASWYWPFDSSETNVPPKSARASWYWPFGTNDASSAERPKRVSELLEPATALIEEASDLAAEGKMDESIGKYREALAELDRIEAENPERAKKTEFATLRNKRAYVNAAIDSLLLGQVKENAKAVAVSDTTELERRLDRERWGKRVEKASKMIDANNLSGALAELERAKARTTNAVQIAMAQSVSAGVRCLAKEYQEACRELVRARQAWIRAGKVTGEETNLVAEALHNVRTRVVGEYEKTQRKVPTEVEKFDVCLAAFLKLVEGEEEVEKRDGEEKDKGDKRDERGERSPVARAPRVPPVRETPRPVAKRERVLAAIALGDWTTAKRLVDEMLRAKPDGDMALNLKAMMEVRQGKLKEAEETLDQAIISNPKSHFAYYNMARLMLHVRADDKNVAKDYYEKGRALGGPVNAELEEMVK